MKTASPARRIVDRVLTAAILTCFTLGAWFWTNSPNTNAAVSKNHGLTQGLRHAQQGLISSTKSESRDANSATKPATRYITKNIEGIREGDFVLSRDEHGSALGYRKVVEVYRRTSYHLRHLTFESEDGTQQTIETTDEHPFWLATQDRWRNAGDLTTGDHVIAPDGRFQILTITHRTEHPLGIPVFNFQVEKSHTYFVTASAVGQTPLLVHNANCDGTISLFHGTNSTGKSSILRDGILPVGGDDGAFHVANKLKDAAGWGDEIVELRVPSDIVHDLFQQGQIQGISHLPGSFKILPSAFETLNRFR